GTTSLTKDTVCPYCACGCSLSVDVKDNHIIRSKPGNEMAVNNGTACLLGCYALDFVSSPQRLTQPLVKVNGNLEPATWEQALQAATQGFKKFMEIYGSKSLAVLGSPKCPNEDNYVLQKFAWCVLGTSNIDNSSSLYSTSNFLLPSVNTGLFGATHKISELVNADLIMIAGSDLEIAAPILSYAVKRAVKYHGAKLILIDAGENHLDYLASLRLKPLPGTETALLNCLSRVIVDQSLYDADYIVHKVKNFDEFQVTLHGHLPERIEAVTGIPGDDLVRAASFFASARNPKTLFGDDALSSSPDAAGQALINLLVLTGNLQKGRGGFIPVLRDSNTLGSWDMGNLTGYLPCYMDISDLHVRKSFEEHPSINISGKSGLNVLDIFRNTGSIIKGLYIVGENPVGWMPHSTMIQDAFNKVEFLVVQDIFLSGTARLADVVLPACSTLEREGTFTNFEGRVQKFHPVIQPVPGCLPDWEIMVRMSQQMSLALDFNSLHDIRREIEDLVPIYRGYSNLSRTAAKSLDTQPARHQYIEGLFTGKYAFMTGQADTTKLPVSTIDEIGSEKKLTGFGTGTRTKQASRLNRTAAHSGWRE
ncbi:MAG TPA: molybdopterin-dependent oxidoreductase, partial [Dehalococcoidia bacterium]|nr:molybdopterin-dependent oxidoreductase [Dehalococcoidia bacterium]